MKQNKKATTLIGYLLTICTMIAALLIGWNHMNEIAQGPKSKEEIGYYQWDKKQIHFQTLQRLHIKGKSMKRQMAVEME